METEQLLKSSMLMIASSGDARDYIQKALNHTQNSEIELAKEELNLANEKLCSAHIEQTKVLQKAMEKADDEASKLLFSHAQDTLMTINSEYYLAKQIIECFDVLNQRLIQLEEKLNEKN